MEMESKSNQQKRWVSVDTMLSIVGEFGPFQWLLDGLFCFLIVPRTFQILIMYFAAMNPTWKCVSNSSICLLNGTFSSDDDTRCSMPRSEWEFTEPKEFSIVTQFDIYCDSEWQIYMTTSILFIGWTIGAIVIGWVADNYGRTKILYPCLMTTLLVGLLSAFMPEIYSFVVCRFVIGFFAPGAGVQMFILISEFVGYKYRPMAGILLWFFFTIGLCLLGLKAYFIRQWKLLMIVCTAPYLFMIVTYKFVPESVRWLHIQGKLDEAMGIFKRISAWNKKELPEDVSLALPPTISVEHKSSPLDLFRTRRLVILNSIQGFAWMVNAIVYYGISIAANDLSGSLYRDYVLISAVEFPAAVTAIYLCDRIGRKKTVMWFMVCGSVACVVVAAIPDEGDGRIARIILGMLGKFCITLSFDSIYTWSVELFPTSHRAEGMGFLQITSRVGAASSPWVAKGLRTLHKTLPFVVMGSLALVAAGFLSFLPETKGRETDELSTSVDVSNEDVLLKDVSTKSET